MTLTEKELQSYIGRHADFSIKEIAAALRNDGYEVSLGRLQLAVIIWCTSM